MIYWDLLLGINEKDLKEALARMYEEMPLAEMAEFLGVSVSALRTQLKKRGIPLRPRGGKHVYYEKGG